MQRRTTTALLIVAGLAATLITAARVDALAIMLPAGPAKVAQADVIVTGQVTSIEDRDVEATPNPQTPNVVRYKVAVIQIKDTLKGNGKLKTIRVGFIPPMAVNPGGPKIGPGKNYNVQLALGQDGLFFLRKHHAADFYTLPMFGTFVPSQNNANFNKEIDTTRKTLKVMENPMAGLKAVNPDDRLETVYYLVTLYRTYPIGTANAQQEPIKADESQLILRILLEADWDAAKYQGDKFQQNPAQIFSRLNIGVAEGFEPPVGQPFNSPEYTKAVKNWLMQNWQNFQIKKYVAGNAKVGGPGGIQIQPK